MWYIYLDLAYIYGKRFHVHGTNDLGCKKQRRKYWEKNLPTSSGDPDYFRLPSTGCFSEVAPSRLLTLQVNFCDEDLSPFFWARPQATKTHHEEVLKNMTHQHIIRALDFLEPWILSFRFGFCQCGVIPKIHVVHNPKKQKPMRWLWCVVSVEMFPGTIMTFSLGNIQSMVIWEKAHYFG